ncbi:hypothetical protein [Sinorhizobium meliloti]|uniref:hypothetical protein n=1 Tax=Rhizobium meliloti TaxID=382 RepID=UPI001F2AC503|nr:hypothetical protein [Sinorhizobium meliloti]
MVTVAMLGTEATWRRTPDAQAHRRSKQERPIASLAARSPTQDRLARLEGSGAIAGYTVVEGTPPTIVQATHLLARFESGKTCDQIAPRLKGIPFVTRINFLDWRNDLLVSVDAVQSTVSRTILLAETCAIIGQNGFPKKIWLSLRG